MNFKLKTPNSKTSSLILFYAHLADGKRFVYSTGQKIPAIKREGDKSYKISTEAYHDSLENDGRSVWFRNHS